jgi:hypothetical protein
MDLLFKNKIRLSLLVNFRILISLKKLILKISHSTLNKWMREAYKNMSKIKKWNKQWSLCKEWILQVPLLSKSELTKCLKRMMKIICKLKIKKYLDFSILRNRKKKISMLSKNKQTISQLLSKWVQADWLKYKKLMALNISK